MSAPQKNYLLIRPLLIFEFLIILRSINVLVICVFVLINVVYFHYIVTYAVCENKVLSLL